MTSETRAFTARSASAMASGSVCSPRERDQVNQNFGIAVGLENRALASAGRESREH